MNKLLPKDKMCWERWMMHAPGYLDDKSSNTGCVYTRASNAYMRMLKQTNDPHWHEWIEKKYGLKTSIKFIHKMIKYIQVRQLAWIKNEKPNLSKYQAYGRAYYRADKRIHCKVKFYTISDNCLYGPTVTRPLEWRPISRRNRKSIFVRVLSVAPVLSWNEIVKKYNGGVKESSQKCDINNFN